MNYVWKLMSNLTKFCNEINSATLTGAIDVIVIQQEDGTYLSSPFHVRFGKIGVLRSRAKVVDIEINGEPVDIHMKLGETGEAFFVVETEDPAEVPSYLATSPIPSISNFDKEMANRNNDGHITDNNSVSVQIVNSNYSEDTVKVWNFPEKPVLDNDPTHENAPVKGLNNAEMSLFNKSEEVTGAEIDSSETSDKFTTKMKKKRRKRTFKRRSVTKTPDQFDHSGTETIGVDNSEDTGEEIFQMDVEDEIDTPNTFKQVVIPATPTPSQGSQLSALMQSNAPEKVEKGHDWGSFSLPLEGLQLPHSGDCTSSAYSDGEVTPVEGRRSPLESRPSTPKSDTEYELRKAGQTGKNLDSQNQWSWMWGELPVPPKVSPKLEHEDPFSDDDTSAKVKEIKKAQDQQRSMLGGVFKMMGMSRNNIATSSGNAESQGMYLEDLSSNDLDPEIAALYLSTNSTWSSQGKGKESTVITIKDDDVESGHGSSLTQSPHSVDGAIGGAQALGVDSDCEEAIPNSESKRLPDVAFALCGNVLQLNAEEAFQQFEKTIITYDQFCSDPNIINHPALMVRMNGKYCNWATAAPIFVSFVLFQRPLPTAVVNDLMKEQSPKATAKSQRRSYWFPWRRSATDGHEQIVSSSSAASSKQDDSSDDSTTKPGQVPIVGESKSVNIEIDSSTAPVEDSSAVNSVYNVTSTDDISEKKKHGSGETYKKSLRLSSKQISQLKLKDGINEVLFSVTTAIQGTTRCKCNIYKWKYDDQIVISDIDGTITKSDVLGHILPIIGESWAQSGVAQLFTSIKKNGYQFLYLSARAIGQARNTRDYLRMVKQDDVTLPYGPLLLSPSSLISALHREVIEKKPEEFKISCLRDIQALFPGRNPFYAGYGNKINDVWAYRAVGIPMSRIYTINYKGVLKHELNRTFQSSYSSLRHLVDHLFPPLRYAWGCAGVKTTDFVGAEEFSSFTYWREPLPNIEISSDLQTGA